MAPMSVRRSVASRGYIETAERIELGFWQRRFLRLLSYIAL